MNHLPFIIAAYALTCVGVVGLALASFLAMRKAEREAEGLRRDP